MSRLSGLELEMSTIAFARDVPSCDLSVAADSPSEMKSGFSSCPGARAPQARRRQPTKHGLKAARPSAAAKRGHDRPPWAPRVPSIRSAKSERSRLGWMFSGFIAMVLCSLPGRAVANREPELLPPEDLVREALDRSDLTVCRHMAAAEGVYGSVVVTAWLPSRRDGSLALDVVATRSLGPRLAKCVRTALAAAVRFPGPTPRR